MPQPEYDRIVAIGDLNGAAIVLRDILRGTDLVDDRGSWIGGRCHLIQMGDIFDRGGGVCAAIDGLQRLAREAREQGGEVTLLLGNHEVMAAQGDRRWCSPQEFLWFATEEEREAWPARVEDAWQQIRRDLSDSPRVLQELRLNQWKHRNAPGRDALWRALEPDGVLGRFVRAMPIALLTSGCVFSHAGLTPRWARLGIDGVNRAAHSAWTSEPEAEGILHSAGGPLWNRELVLENTERSRDQVARALELLAARRMIVGHTPTANIPGAEPGRIAPLYDGTLIAIDVGLDPGAPGAALIIEDGRGMEWTPDGTRVLWQDS